jgi:hypothetical protein
MGDKLHGPSHPKLLHAKEKHQKYFKFFVDNRQKMGGSLLNVGLGPYAEGADSAWIDWFIKELDKPFEMVYILEQKESQAQYYIDYFADRTDVTVYHDDVKKASEYITNVDTIFWHHGVEHILQENLLTSFNELNRITTKAMFWSCPWGNQYLINYPEEYLGHVHYHYPEIEMFTALGLTVFNADEKDSENGEIHAYRFKNDE